MLPSAVRRATSAIAIAAVVVATWIALGRLVDAQQPRTYFDTDVYFQAGARPVSLDSLALAKPPTAPLLDRAAGFEPARIVDAQLAACAACWLALGIALVLALRRPAARVAAIVVVVSFVLAPIRVGWISAMMSESINDSLTILLIALALALVITRRRWVRWVVTALAIAVGVPWMFARDTNAVIAIVAVVVTTAAAWPPLRARWRAGWPAVLAVAAIAGSAVCLWSQRATTTSAALPIESAWDPVMLPRVMFPTVNNLLMRIMPDPDARAFFADRGLPVAELEPFVAPLRSDMMVAATDRPASHAWIVAHGPSTYLSWLAHHPLTRVHELVADWKKLVAPWLRPYMPRGWRSSGLRGWTVNPYIALALLAVAPFALWRPRRDHRLIVALGVIGSGAVGLVASYYGDALEMPRHCWGAGQQVLFGIALALLVKLDRWLCNRVSRRSSVPANRPSP